MTLQSVAISAFAYCPAWHCRMWPDEIHGARCCFCDREIAVVKEAQGKHCACIYCGLDNGELPAIELGPDDDHPPFFRRKGGLKGRKLKQLGFFA